MKKIYIILILFFYFLSVKSQFNCGSISAQNYLFNYDKTAKSHIEKLMLDAETNQTYNLNKAMSVANYTIPVVFHVLHNGSFENISDAQINDAISILSRDFLKKNADTINIVMPFKNIAANCNIEFKLATIDPNGNCTNGITRHYDQNTNWTINFSNYLYTWDASKYLNIYVVKTMPSGIAGYAYYPGAVSASADAIVILSQYVGSIGTANTLVSRALTHEVGHWLNLQHTWGNTNQPGVACGNDGVNDTPLTQGNSACNLNASICTLGIVENVQNFMEYAFCSNMFTVDQRTRMQNALNSSVGLRNNLWTNANLIATGIISPNTACVPKAEYMPTNPITCVGNSLAFIDYSYNAPVTSWKWSSSLALNISTLQNASLTFTNSGLATVKLKVSNGFGADSITKANVIVLAGLGSGNANVVKDFETGIFPDNNWIETTPQYGSSFATYNASAGSGNNCIWVNNFFDNPSEVISFYSPAYNLQNSANAQLNFKYAYIQQSILNDDSLNIYVSNNCGVSWQSIYAKSGGALNTTSSLQTMAFLNPLTSQWKNELINLTTVIGSPKVYFKFKFTSDANGSGNNIFIDDINIISTVDVKETRTLENIFKIYPNPTNSSINIEFLEVNSEPALLQIATTLGLVFKQLEIANGTSTINLDELNIGIYFITLKINNRIKTFKLIKN